MNNVRKQESGSSNTKAFQCLNCQDVTCNLSFDKAQTRYLQLFTASTNSMKLKKINNKIETFVYFLKGM